MDESSSVLEFRSDEIDWSHVEDTVLRRLESLGVRITMSPTPMAWGTFAMFADPDGNEFGLTSQVLA